MSETKRDVGGPAFPIPLLPGQEMPEGVSPDGLAVRDYFAAKVLQRYFDSAGEQSEFAEQARLWAIAYEIADAMIEARKR